MGAGDRQTREGVEAGEVLTYFVLLMVVGVMIIANSRWMDCDDSMMRMIIIMGNNNNKKFGGELVR